MLEADELNGYAVGAADDVTKPFSLSVLYAKVMAMMGLYLADQIFRLHGKKLKVENMAEGVQVNVKW